MLSGMAVVAPVWDELLTGEEVAYRTAVPPRNARLTPVPDSLHPDVAAALGRRALGTLYAHQRAAFEAAEHGENLVVAT